jgi:hypothetical protein
MKGVMKWAVDFSLGEMFPLGESRGATLVYEQTLYERSPQEMSGGAMRGKTEG